MVNVALYLSFPAGVAVTRTSELFALAVTCGVRLGRSVLPCCRTANDRFTGRPTTIESGRSSTVITAQPPNEKATTGSIPAVSIKQRERFVIAFLRVRGPRARTADRRFAAFNSG